GGILADDCAAVLARFFQQRRGCRPIASGDRKGTSAVKDLEAAYAEWDASDDAVLWDSASNDGIADA
ncbi:MAG: hypothetical protein FWF75_06080, partial [Propionibacteriaceae bacterium]|nr:hypothetical protein [Propionibacteriaceae bacterium]